LYGVEQSELYKVQAFGSGQSVAVWKKYVQLECNTFVEGALRYVNVTVEERPEAAVRLLAQFVCLRVHGKLFDVTPDVEEVHLMQIYKVYPLARFCC